MTYRRLNRARLRSAYEAELERYRTALSNDHRSEAWHHLERAHILSQRYFARHWRTHWLMLRMAREDGRSTELRGQLRRLAAVPVGWLSGWVPKGNTGGADVHPLKPMAVEGDLADALQGYSPWKDVALRLVILGTVLVTVTWARAAWAEIREANGELLTITASAASYCTHVPQLVGAEDIVLDIEGARGFAVGGDRRAFRSGGGGRSRVFVFPAEDPTAARDVTPDMPAELKGFGADLLREDDGTVWLGIANRASDGHAVEIYRVGKNNLLTHHVTLSAPKFRNPNDLVLLSPDTALVTLDKRARAGSVWEIVEGARRAPTGRVMRVGADGMTTLADGLLSSNGIVRLDDGRVAVGELVGRRISVFARPEADQRIWSVERRITLPFAVDNLSTPDGETIWAAGHPKLLTLAQGYQRTETEKSPSMAMWVDPTIGRTGKLFEDNGRFLSASSVAVALPGDRSIVGTAFGPAVALCGPLT